MALEDQCKNGSNAPGDAYTQKNSGRYSAFPNVKDTAVEKEDRDFDRGDGESVC